VRQRLATEVGDFVLRRADGYWAYQIAVVVDDGDCGITDVVRGADLLDSTARQIYLQRLLGLPTPRYMHVPVLVNERGEKLSKQTGAAALDAGRPLEGLMRAADFLGLALPRPHTVGEFWPGAVAAWKDRHVAA
jgi:glutamyl-Q tRNA(Asp) synthetase